MKKKIFLFLCVLINLSVYATVHTVCNDPTGLAQFNEIQPAIDAASSGDTIYVQGSSITYGGFIVMNKRLTIIGPGWSPNRSFPIMATVSGAFIAGVEASGTEIQGLVFTLGDVSIDAQSGTVPLNLRFIRNQFNFDFSIGRDFTTGKAFENFVFEGNYFNGAGLVGKNINKHRNFDFRNNLFTVRQTPFRLPNSSDFQIDHNLFYRVQDAIDTEIGIAQSFLITNNIFNGVNLAGTSDTKGVSLSTFSNNITFADFINTPWNVNNNIDGGGNIENEDPQMADQNAVNAGANSPLMNFTIAAGPANNSGSDAKDLGLLYDPTGTLNWNESRNSNLPRVLTLFVQQTQSQDTLLVFAAARKSPGAPDFLQAEYFIDSDPGVGNGIPIELPSTPDSIGFNSLVPINELSEGEYRISIRVQLANGIWSLFETASFINENDPPVANAGTDQVITLPQDSIALEGFGSFDPDGTIIFFQWTKISGPEQGTIDNSEPPFGNTMVRNLASGTYQFELMVADNSNLPKIDRDTVIIIVNSPPVAKAGKDRSITLPTNSLTLDGSQSFDADGVITSFKWRKISGPSTGTVRTPDQATTLVSNLSQGLYSFELLVIDNHGATDRDTVNVTVNPAPIPPNANAGSDKLVLLPTSFTTLDGRASSDPDGTITAFFWRKISGPAGGTLSNPTQSVTNATNLTRGIYRFELRVTDNSGLSDRDTVQVTVTKPPVANAGSDQTITLPSNGVTLNGSSSFDPDGTIVNFLWSRVSGPSGSTITNPNQAVTSVTNLIEGVYQFRLIVTDNSGASAKDVVQVTVNSFPVGRVASNSRINAYTSFILGNDNQQSIQAYPNPFQEKITIEVPVQCSGALVNILGRTVTNLKLSKGINEVDTDTLEPGFYYLQIGKKTLKVQRK